MNGKKKLAGLISLSVLIPMLLYAAGIIAQLITNINEWKEAGSNYGLANYDHIALVGKDVHENDVVY